jgi:hypothetical protein
MCGPRPSAFAEVNKRLLRTSITAYRSPLFRSAEGQRPGKVFRVCSGRNRQPFNWEDIETQSLLGVDGFAGGLQHLGDGKAMDSRNTKGPKIRRAAEFREAIFTEKPRQSITRSVHRASVITHAYSQIEVANRLGLHFSTFSRILAANQ